MRGVRAFVHEERLQRFAVEERTEQKSMLNLCSGKCCGKWSSSCTCLCLHLIEKSGIAAKQSESEPTPLGDFSSVRLVDNVLAVCTQVSNLGVVH